jgi:hypothetical protein
VTHMKARDPKKAHEWIFPLDIGPCNALETGFDKLLLCGLWRTAYDVTPWGVGVQSMPQSDVGRSLGFPPECAEVEASYQRLLKYRWVSDDRDRFALSWGEPFRDEHRCSIYAVEFSNGVVKIGRSREPAARIKTHLRIAAKMGLRGARLWASPAMGAGWAAERAVLDHVRQAFPTTAGAEYFEGGFDVALDFFGHDPADAQVCA